MQFLNLGEQYTEDVLGKRKQKHPRGSAEIKNLICPVSSNFPQLMYVYISTYHCKYKSERCFLFMTLSWGFPLETDCETPSL